MLYKQAYNLITKQAAWYDDPDTLKRIGGGAAGALLGGGLGALKGKGTAIAGALGGGVLGTAAGDLATGDNSYIRRVISGKGGEPAVVEEVVTTEEPAPAPEAKPEEKPEPEDKKRSTKEKVTRGISAAIVAGAGARAGYLDGIELGNKIDKKVAEARGRKIISELIDKKHNLKSDLGHALQERLLPAKGNYVDSLHAGVRIPEQAYSRLGLDMLAPIDPKSDAARVINNKAVSIAARRLSPLDTGLQGKKLYDSVKQRYTAVLTDTKQRQILNRFLKKGAKPLYGKYTKYVTGGLGGAVGGVLGDLLGRWAANRI